MILSRRQTEARRAWRVCFGRPRIAQPGCNQGDDSTANSAAMQSTMAMDGDRCALVQSQQYITIENSGIAATKTFSTSQYATIRNNRIHAADDWCAYVKGGSAMSWLEANEIADCGTGGFTAGRGTGFEYMTAPWLHH